jgi:hypothetical protein
LANVDDDNDAGDVEELAARHNHVINDIVLYQPRPLRVAAVHSLTHSLMLIVEPLINVDVQSLATSGIR